MKLKRILLISGLVLVLSLTGCGDTGGGATGPSNAPVLTSAAVNPSQTHPGAIVIFSIDFVDPGGDLNGGTAVITDNQGSQPYNGVVSNADGTAGTLTTSIELSPLLRSGEVVFYIYVIDRAGNPSNTIPATVTVL